MKKKQPSTQGHQETISAAQFFAEVIPSYNQRTTIVYLYVCPGCGWWTVSDGVDEVFGSFARKPGLRTEPCERCGLAPMHLMKRDDLLRVVIESEKEQAAYE